MNNLSSAGQFLELWLDSNGHFVRIDLHSKSVTTTFTDWFNWHVDTAQVEVARGVFHFVEPDGRLVGIKSVAIDSAHSGRSLQ